MNEELSFFYLTIFCYCYVAPTKIAIPFKMECALTAILSNSDMYSISTA